MESCCESQAYSNRNSNKKNSKFQLYNWDLEFFLLEFNPKVGVWNFFIRI